MNALSLRIVFESFVTVFILLVLSACGGAIDTYVTKVNTDLSVSLVPARTSGVAPLSVFFDATGTSDIKITGRPFHDIEYKWSFGDSNAGNWTNGAGLGSKNSASGPIAAHIYETPGTYTVTVTAYDGHTSVSANSTVTVQDPNSIFAGANTICFSPSDYTDCPVDATHVTTSDFASAINTYQASNRRLLFRRGETFSASTSAAINKTGPGIVGAFGAGASPVVQMSGNQTILKLSSGSTPGIKDWRVMDLDFDGNSGSAVIGIDADGEFNQLLALRLNLRNMMRGIAATVSILDWWNTHGQSGHKIYSEWSIVDSTIVSSANYANSDWRIFLANAKGNIQGNYLDNFGTGGSHTIRTSYMGKGIISNNYIARAGATQHALKLHAPTWCDNTVTPGCNYTNDTMTSTVFTIGTGYTEKVVISDNKFVGASNAWTVSMGPQNGQSDERVRDVIAERNWFVGGTGTQVAIESSATEVTIRNNICDTTVAASHLCFSIGQRGIEPPPNNAHIYNNTLYSGSTGSFAGVSIDTTPTNVSVINNLGSSPLASSATMVNGTGASGFVAMSNSTGSQIKSTTPGWVTSPPLVPMDYKLTSGSYALGIGASVPVFSDFFLQTRAGFDLGAAGI